MGKRMGAVGAAMLAFMLWVVHRALLQESIVIQDSIVKVQCSKHIILIGLHNQLIIMVRRTSNIFRMLCSVGCLGICM